MHVISAYVWMGLLGTDSTLPMFLPVQVADSSQCLCTRSLGLLTNQVRTSLNKARAGVTSWHFDSQAASCSSLSGQCHGFLLLLFCLQKSPVLKFILVRLAGNRLFIQTYIPPFPPFSLQPLPAFVQLTYPPEAFTFAILEVWHRDL